MTEITHDQLNSSSIESNLYLNFLNRFKLPLFWWSLNIHSTFLDPYEYNSFTFQWNCLQMGFDRFRQWKSCGIIPVVSYIHKWRHLSHWIIRNSNQFVLNSVYFVLKQTQFKSVDLIKDLKVVKLKQQMLSTGFYLWMFIH